MSSSDRPRSSLLRRVHYRAILLRRKLDPAKRRQYILDRLVGPLGYWNELRSYQLELLKNMGLRPEHSLLDIGCGPLQGGIAFMRYLETNRYVGIDLNEEPLQWGYKQIVEERLAGKNPRLVRSDTFGMAELKTYRFDFIWLSQVMYHLDKSLLEQLLDALANFSHASTNVYGDILCTSREGLRPDSKWREFDYHSHKVDDIKKAAAARGLEVEPIGTLRDYGYPPRLQRASNTLLKFSKSV